MTDFQENLCGSCCLTCNALIKLVAFRLVSNLVEIVNFATVKGILPDKVKTARHSVLRKNRETMVYSWWIWSCNFVFNLKDKLFAELIYHLFHGKNDVTKQTCYAPDTRSLGKTGQKSKSLQKSPC